MKHAVGDTSKPAVSKPSEGRSALTTFTVLIWEELPERVDLYLVPDHVAKAYWPHLEAAQGKYRNEGEDPSHGLLIVSAAVMSPERRDEVKAEFRDHVGVFDPYLVSSENPIRGEVITVIYRAGALV